MRMYDDFAVCKTAGCDTNLTSLIFSSNFWLHSCIFTANNVDKTSSVSCPSTVSLFFMVSSINLIEYGFFFDVCLFVSSLFGIVYG